MFIVYALKSEVKNYIYVGLTKDIDNRIKRHNAGYEKTTRNYRPFKLIYTETYPDRIKAREKGKIFQVRYRKRILKSF